MRKESKRVKRDRKLKNRIQKKRVKVGLKELKAFETAQSFKLEVAVCNDDVAAVKELLRRGVDPMIRDGMSLVLASIGKNTEITELLCPDAIDLQFSHDLGIVQSIRDGYFAIGKGKAVELTPNSFKALLSKGNCLRWDSFAFKIACQKNRLEIVREILNLDEAPCESDVQIGLAGAAVFGSIEVIDLLLSRYDLDIEMAIEIASKGSPCSPKGISYLTERLSIEKDFLSLSNNTAPIYSSGTSRRI